LKIVSIFKFKKFIIRIKNHEIELITTQHQCREVMPPWWSQNIFALVKSIFEVKWLTYVGLLHIFKFGGGRVGAHKIVWTPLEYWASVSPFYIKPELFEWKVVQMMGECIRKKMDFYH
jgi:hypothetical protein